MDIDLGSILSSLGLTGAVNNAADYLKNQVVAFKSLPNSYARMLAQQKAIVSKPGIAPSDLAETQTLLGTITGLQYEWTALDPQVDTIIATAQGGNADIGSAAGALLQMTDLMNRSKAASDRLDQLAGQYQIPTSDGSLSIGVLVLLGVGGWLLLRKR